ncbi:hypothetical protein SGODD07_01977 [Streptococcus gordonii]|uniref:Uncharacterized protein n=1 Tax=Streptococcus gordonii TaxID=1302 RepID=A0A139MYR8_STRGN|nr:hypothetical protein SGODD07_01977 [Streptococcus gordonii]
MSIPFLSVVFVSYIIPHLPSNEQEKIFKFSEFCKNNCSAIFKLNKKICQVTLLYKKVLIYC